MKKFLTLTSLAAMLAFAPLPSALAASNTAAVLTTYGNIAHAGYEDSLITAKTLKTAISALIASPSKSNLAAAKAAWVKARVPYQQTEAYRFGNAIVCDALGNVAETATANIFMVKDGEVFTPAANGTFLAGITRARHMSNLRADGVTVHETVLTFEDFHGADEVFMSGNMSKVTPVTAFDDTQYQIGPIARRAREMYWDWAASNG